MCTKINHFGSISKGQILGCYSLQLAYQSLCYPKGILEDVCVWVGHSYVPVDFVVVETCGNEKAPIILGRPFLRTAKAIIYTDDAKICFTIKGRK
jgi:hypothetical protein